MTRKLGMKDDAVRPGTSIRQPVKGFVAVIRIKLHEHDGSTLVGKPLRHGIAESGGNS